MVLNDYLTQRFSNKQIWIVGVGREGLSTYSLLRKQLPDLRITLVDDSPLEKLDPQVSKAVQENNTNFLEGNQVSITQLSPEIIAFKTPGIPSSHLVVAALEHSKITILSNTQLFFDILQELDSSPTTIGITGTKGKSTTTSMIYHVLKENGKTAFLAGNIGTPPLDLVEPLSSLENPSDSYVVLEMSSHQLRELTTSPHIAVIQNITPEHLDYYPNFETYQKAKKSITRYQNSDNAIIFCPRFDTVVDILSEFAQRYTFDVEPKNSTGLTAYATETDLFVSSEKLMSIADIPLVGKHNLYNTLPSVIIGKISGLSNNQITTAIKSFKGLPHRLEFVTKVDGVAYYNDSQATTPEAAIAALRSFNGAQIHLIAGGSDKGVDLSEFAKEILNTKVKTIILFPPMGTTIDNLIHENLTPDQLSATNIFHVDSMAEAVTIARQHANSGDIVLLSPACASFGIFKNYQDRGDQFKQEVKR